jgi:hypothetical protein
MLIMKSSTIRKLFVTCLSVLLSIPAGFRAAWAYRPFDGTDAAVADPGEVEIELQPAGAQWVNREPNLVAPALVYNYGLIKDWELVLEGRGLTPLSPSGPTEVTEAAASLKYILRPGVLQDKPGPSIATEFGVLLPDSIGPSGFGATVAGIVSQRWDWGTVHLNVETALTRDQRANVFGGAIIEGPYQWKVRPVAEFFYEEEFGSFHSVSGLIGAIWQVRDNLSFDVAFRHASTNGHPVEEVRAGMTFGFQLIPFKRMGQK